MLAFGIRYLNGWVAARTDPSSPETEWPPHPGRVFMALAAAHFQMGTDPEERKALLWLESLERHGEPLAPCIVASNKCERAVVTHYVPVNDDSAGCKKKQGKTVVFQEIGQTGLRRNRQDRTFARAWLENDTAYLRWPGIEPNASVREALAGLCAKVTRIGHSMSMVQMWLAGDEEAGEPTWVPDDERATIHLRLAARGTLEYLERQFNGDAVEDYAAILVSAADATNKKAQKAARKRLREKFPTGEPPQLRPSLSVFQGYAPPEKERPEAEGPGTVFSPHLIVLRLEPESGPYRQLDLACTLVIAGRWREALLSHSNDLSETVRGALSGHDSSGAPLEGPHFAIAPLAFVGHEHADGHLLGLGAALPRDLSPDDRRGLLRALGRVRQVHLGRLGVWRLEAVTEARPARNLRDMAWTAHPRGATEWSTVTPVAFDRHPKASDKGAYREEVAAMITRCCTRVGLPEPREVIVTPVSAHLGAPPAHGFPRLQRKDGSQRRHTHAILVFDAPVRGPMLLGAGRYRGYGLCRPLDGPREGRAES